jgi:hypothetical protein
MIRCVVLVAQIKIQVSKDIYALKGHVFLWAPRSPQWQQAASLPMSTRESCTTLCDIIIEVWLMHALTQPSWLFRLCFKTIAARKGCVV